MKPQNDTLLCLALTLSLLAATSLAGAQAPPTSAPVRLPGHMPAAALASARPLGHVDSTERIDMAIVLPLRNQAELDDLLHRLYDPLDPSYGQYLTPQEFTDRFAPTQADYDAVAAYARSQGLTITGTHPNRTILDVAGPAQSVENAFNVHLLRYQSKEGRLFRAPDADPQVPAGVAQRVAGIVGLDTAAVFHSHHRPLSSGAGAHFGTGPAGGLAPNDIKTAYGLNGLSTNGSGRTLGLMELDGYFASTINTYKTQFGLPDVPLQNVLVDGFSGQPGKLINGNPDDGPVEVALDIELQIALAPGASKILVYEAPNTQQAVVDVYNRIANDNRAKEISTSWGLAEDELGIGIASGENSAFQQMAAQGQSIYAASGDNGAKDDKVNLSVDDPASQPYVCGTGGTSLSLNADLTYKSETTWNNSTGAGGGGLSTIWPLPWYQTSFAIPGNTSGILWSAHRQVPDVSLDADPNTGYAVFVTVFSKTQNKFVSFWTSEGGTSCAAPLWAAFTALVNATRAQHGIAAIGFPLPEIYADALNTYEDYHDIADNSSNGGFNATTGYDCATGLGSFKGAKLLNHLARIPSTVYVSTGPDNNMRMLTAYQDGSLSLRTVDSSGNPISFYFYGAFANFTAVSMATGPDNITHILWVRTDGLADVWNMAPDGHLLGSHHYGPFTNWTPEYIAVGPDNVTRLLWHNTNNSISLWRINASGAKLDTHIYGPFTDWTPRSMGVGADNKTRLLWTLSTGKISLWTLDADEQYLGYHYYGPYSGWTARSLSVGEYGLFADNVTRLFWTQSDGTVSVWTLDPNENSLGSQVYGPYSAWTAESIATGPDNNSHLLWLNGNGTLSLWQLDSNGVYQNYHYYSP